jgi:hypothetical protein
VSRPSHGSAKDKTTDLLRTGSSALAGLSFYTYYSGMNQLRAQRKAIEMSKSKYKFHSRQLGIIGISASLFSLAWYRILN